MGFKHFIYSCILLCLVIAGTLQVSAQGTSNKGTDFWVAYSGHVDGTASRLTLFITSAENAKVTIVAGGTTLPVVNLNADQAKSIVIDPGVYTNVYMSTNDGIGTNKGIHVTSDKPIVVYSLISHSARSAACLVYPTKALGNDYYAISYVQLPDAGGEIRSSQFTIVGVENSTSIEITPTQNSRGNAAHVAGVPFVITLNKGDVYQYQSVDDLSGTRIKTVNGCKPFSVFSGSSKNGFCQPSSSVTQPAGQDNLYQQLLPISTWGKNFVSAPFYNSLNGSTDIYRIQVAEDNTTVSVNGSTTNANGTQLNNPYAKGSIITFTSQSSNVVNADKPINLTQFQTSQNCNPKNSGALNFPGDPEMTILNPIEQTLKDVTVYSAISTPQAITNIDSHYINVIIKTTDAASLTVDGITFQANADGSSFQVNKFVKINSEYSYIIVDVTQSSAINPTHRIKANGGFVAIAYGYGNVESYGYLAGADLRNLNRFIQPANVSTKQPLITGCINNPFELYVNIPYKTLSLKWDLGNGVTLTDPDPDAHYTIQTINGETLYRYSYFGANPVYNAAGIYNIKATVTNPAPIACDAEEIVELSYQVFDLPTSDFTTSQPACKGTAVTFTDKSLGKGQAIKKWYWDFGDGTPVETRLSADPFTHIYTSSGDFTASVIVEVESGCLSSAGNATPVHIYKLPEIKFISSLPSCETGLVSFTDQSSLAEGTIIKWNWDFDDPASGVNNFSTLQHPQHVFDKAGRYNVKLTVQTDKGCTSSAIFATISNPLPVIDFELPEICITDAAATFKNTSSIADATENSFTYLWNFGDPASGSRNTATTKDAVHQYPREGEFFVTLTIKSGNGCSATRQKRFIVNGQSPVTEFGISETVVCSDNEVVFEDLSTVSPGKVAKIEWYFDETNHPNNAAYKLVELEPENTADKKYIFKYPITRNLTPQVIDVRMRAFSGETCFSDKIHQITIKGQPEIEFKSVASVCVNDKPFQLQAKEIHGFRASSVIYTGPGVSPAGVFDPKEADIGQHTITYTFTTTDNCVQEKSQIITVNSIPVIIETNDITILKGGEKELFTSSLGDGLKYKWFPSAGLDNDTIPNPIASPLENTTYRLTVSNGSACSVFADVRVNVKESPDIPNAFSPNADGTNDTWSIPYLETLVRAKIQIFNRYGQVVFASGQYNTPWDGTFKGKEVPVGVYYYIIEPNNGRKKHVGSITLLR